MPGVLDRQHNDEVVRSEAVQDLSRLPAPDFDAYFTQLAASSLHGKVGTYRDNETSYYRQETIQARQWFQEGKFGELFYVEGEYWHERLEELMYEADGSPTWGLAGMLQTTSSVMSAT